MDWNNNGPRITNTQVAQILKEQIVKMKIIFASEKAVSDYKENICNMCLTKG